MHGRTIEKREPRKIRTKAIMASCIDRIEDQTSHRRGLREPPAGQHSSRLIPRTKGQFNNWTQTLGHDYFVAKRAVSVKLINELKV